jgi:BirA family biotin operon repressor/biotin-[acetyl-CoA-carboxylase] ligase
VSVVLAPSRARLDPERATSLLTLAAGVAIAEAIQTVTGLGPDLKWPNDLYVGRRKLAGILAEGIGVSGGGPPSQSFGASADARGQRERAEAEAPREVIKVVLGYGINVGPMACPPELADRATSLESELGRPIDRAAVCVETLAAIAARYDDLLEGRFDAILDAWRRRAPAHRGTRVSWETASGMQSGITQGIDERGALLVRVGERVERIVGGELLWE